MLVLPLAGNFFLCPAIRASKPGVSQKQPKLLTAERLGHAAIQKPAAVSLVHCLKDAGNDSAAAAGFFEMNCQQSPRFERIADVNTERIAIDFLHGCSPADAALPMGRLNDNFSVKAGPTDCPGIFRFHAWQRSRLYERG
jgi:hypothetical protein